MGKLSLPGTLPTPQRRTSSLSSVRPFKFTRSTQAELDRLERGPRDAGLVKQVKKTLGFLQTNPRHPSLQTHVFHSLEHPYTPKEKVFEAYVQQHTPAAYRLFWCHGPKKGQITVIAITAHP